MDTLAGPNPAELRHALHEAADWVTTYVTNPCK